jgi:hypothetical protein
MRSWSDSPAAEYMNTTASPSMAAWTHTPGNWQEEQQRRVVNRRVAALDGAEPARWPAAVPAQDLGGGKVVLGGHGAEAGVVEDLQRYITVYLY